MKMNVKMMLRTLFYKDMKNILKKSYSTPSLEQPEIVVGRNSYKTDSFTNITPKIISNMERKMYLQNHHPLNLIKQRIINFMYMQFKNSRGNPKFSVHETLSPIITPEKNFDYVLIPENHPARSTRDNYYINKDYVLRAHTTAHQRELILAGLENFLVVGDVYRRDTIDARHYPIFHQMDSVRLCSADDIYRMTKSKIEIFQNGERTPKKQEGHTEEAVQYMEYELKITLEKLVKSLFGEIELKWVETTFPFTHPSWEMEIKYQDKWLEVLGCGIMEQRILAETHCLDKMGWAFGLGLERLAMIMYQIPDIRLFWSKDSGFLSQFKTDNIEKKITYKPISQYPQCINDISFYIGEKFQVEDMYDMVREIGGDIVEQVELIDEYTNPKTGRTSHCYRIIYRHMEKTLTKNEVNLLHHQIESQLVHKFGVQIR